MKWRRNIRSFSVQSRKWLVHSSIIGQHHNFWPNLIRQTFPYLSFSFITPSTIRDWAKNALKFGILNITFQKLQSFFYSGKHVWKLIRTLQLDDVMEKEFHRLKSEGDHSLRVPVGFEHTRWRIVAHLTPKIEVCLVCYFTPFAQFIIIHSSTVTVRVAASVSVLPTPLELVG